jgi:hypothetical protein
MRPFSRSPIRRREHLKQRVAHLLRDPRNAYFLWQAALPVGLYSQIFGTVWYKLIENG